MFSKKSLSLMLCSVLGTVALQGCGGGGASSDDGGGTVTPPTSSTSNTVINSTPIAPGIAHAVLEAHNTAGVHANLIVIDSAAFSGARKDLFTNTTTVFELETYDVRADKLIEFKREADQLIITNWVPRHLDNILVVANYQGKKYKVMSVNKLIGIHRFSLQLPWSYGESKFQAIDNADIVDFSTIDTTDVTFEITPQDDVQKEIAGIDVTWRLTFPDRVMLGDTDVCRDANVVWRPTRPQDARYLLSFLINAAQTVSHPQFEAFWNKTAFINWDATIAEADKLTRAEYDTYTVEEKAVYDQAALDAGKYYNKAHRAKIYERYEAKHFAAGMTGGGGLGGGSTLGLNHTPIFEEAWAYSDGAAQAFERGEWFIMDQTLINGTPWNIMGHESGHTLGFGHNASYTVRAENSHIAVGTIVYSWLVKNGKTIVNAETMVGRDESWEQPYNKDNPGPERSRPRCGDAYEWGGAYERHDIQMPVKNSAEWVAYLEAHRVGQGLDYLKSLLP